MTRSRTSPALPFSKGRLLLLLFFLLLLYVVVPRLGNFSQSFSALGRAEPVLIGVAVVFVVATYALAAGVYYLLAIRRLRYSQIVTVQIASAFTNRVLPAGLGALTLYVQYLRKSGHTLSQALAIVGTNNLLGTVGHGLLALLALSAAQGALPPDFHMPRSFQPGVIAVVAVLVIVANLLVFSRLRHYLYALTKEIMRHVLRYRKRPARLAAALVCSCLLTTSYILIFYTSALALDVHVSIVQAFIVFTLGIVAATVTPTPGGLVGAEAGLTGGLVLYGVPASEALAVALLYRFLTYWLPLVPGFIVFVAHRKLYL